MYFKTLLQTICICFLCIQCSNEAQTKPTVYLVGDSTVKNGRGDGGAGLWGWGDFIGQLLDTTKVSVKNHALGGTSSRTFQDKGLWDSVNVKLKKGDFVFIQFGHNDDGPINDDFRARGTIKGIGNESEEIDNMLTGKHETVHSYGWYIRKIVTDAKKKGATPIVVSPIPRNKWKENKVPRNNTSYGLWAKQVAAEENVLFIDLNEQMSHQLEEKGEATVTGTYFYDWDHTHTNAKGAALAAKIVVNEVKKSTIPLASYIEENTEITFPKKKNLFLVGDSTMANNGNENAVGWGVHFEQYFDTTRINILNKARGGRSSRTFMNEGLWDSVKKQIQPGDFVFLQFGHNDAGNINKAKYRGSLEGTGEETETVVKQDSIKETVHTFGWYMKKYIQETKEKQATPIVLSLTPRNEWPNGVVEQRDSTYIKWAEEVAKSEGAFYINLSDAIASKYTELGKEKVKDFFPKDHTHTGAEGAEFSAKIVVESIRNLKEIPLRDYIKREKKK